MCKSFIILGHSPANHLLPNTAAKPPWTHGESEKGFNTSEDIQSLNKKQDFPLKFLANSYHIFRSSLASEFSVIPMMTGMAYDKVK